MAEKKGGREGRKRHVAPELRKGESLRKITAQTGSRLQGK